MICQSPELFLKELGIDPQQAPKSGGNYVPVNVRGQVAYVAIQFPISRDVPVYTGRLGKDRTTAEGYEAARLSAINVLAQIHKFIGLDQIEGLNHFDLCYQCVDSWDEAPTVANGASDLFISALATKGLHSRSILGVHSLPKNFTVAITASFTIL